MISNQHVVSTLRGRARRDTVSWGWNSGDLELYFCPRSITNLLYDPGQITLPPIYFFFVLS